MEEPRRGTAYTVIAPLENHYGSNQFFIGTVPSTMFFAGAIAQLPFAVENLEKKILLVTGGSSLKKSGRLDAIERLLKSKNIYYAIVTVHGEPSPQLVDAVVKQFADKEINAVVSIGGGSVIDAGKAISAMLPLNESVYDYLEVVGTKLMVVLKFHL
jgi:alcohol dehydrogenase class IV